MRILLILLLFAPSLGAQQPKPPVHRPRIDTGWYTRIHAGAALYDGITSRGRYERNPIVRPLVGTPVSLKKEVLFGSVVVVGVSAIPNKRVRRITQVILIGTHLYFGSRNLIARRGR